MKVYSFEYNGKIHYMIPTYHTHYTLINNNIIDFVTNIIKSVDICAFEIDAYSMLKNKKNRKNKKTLNDAYQPDELKILQQHIETKYKVKIPLNELSNNDLIPSIMFPNFIISNHLSKNENDKKMFFDVKIHEIAMKNKKDLLFLDDNKYIEDIKEKHNSQQKNLLEEHIIQNPPSIKTIETTLNLSNKFKNYFEHLYISKNVKSDLIKLSNSGSILKNEELDNNRNKLWVKKIISYLDKNQNQSIAIIIGMYHIFQIINSSNPIPDLLEKIPGVSNIKYTTISF